MPRGRISHSLFPDFLDSTNSLESDTTRPQIACSTTLLAPKTTASDMRDGEAVEPMRLYKAARKHLQNQLRNGQNYRHLADRFGPGGDGNNSRDISSFICASDASFGDNTIDRKSSQGYIMKLFGGPVAWRANKQDTVTTSSTEAELLAISQTAKESIYLARLMKALKSTIPETLTIECDNAQTICLLVDESIKLQTKLRHVDIHSHWLRQEVQRGSIAVRWVPTKQMIADGLTKALIHANHEDFVGMTGLENRSELLATIQMEEDLIESFLQSRSGPETGVSFEYMQQNPQRQRKRRISRKNCHL